MPPFFCIITSENYAAYTGVKHFLVDAGIPEEYHFVGPKQQNFKSLPELLRFYRYVNTVALHLKVLQVCSAVSEVI